MLKPVVPVGLAGFLALIVAAGGAACGDDEVKYDPTLAVAVETSVAPGQVAAGERATVTCVRVNGRGEPLIGGQFVIGIEPLEQSFVEGAEVFANLAGTHKITCSDGELGLLDKTPAELVVVAGPAVATRLTLTPSEVPAGEDAAVSCQAVDVHGNVALANLRLETTPSTSVTADGVTAISATVAGSYEVTCFAATVDEAARAKATLTVVPAARATVGIVFDPEKPFYAKGEIVNVVGRGVDAFGNRRDEPVPLQDVAATPAGQHTVSGPNLDRIAFSAEDHYVVTAAAKDDPDQTASAPLVVDETPPVLVLKSPDRGVVTDTLTKITVSGNVSDNLGVVSSLTIAGQTVALQPAGGAFSVDIPLHYGINLLDVHARDPQGFETLVTRAVEQGLGGFRPMTGRTFETDGVANAAALVLTQEAFDDDDGNDRDDLASIVETIVKNLDFTGLVPNPLTSFSCISGSCTLELTKVSMSDVNVTMALTPGRIHLEVELVDFAGEMTLFFPCATQFICATPPTGALPATFKTNTVVLKTDFLVSVVNGVAEAQTENTTVAIDGLTATVTGDPTGLLQAALTGAVELLRGILLDVMEALIVTLVEDQVGGALDGLFGALAIDQTFDLPSPVPNQPPNTLVIKTRAKGVDIAPERLQLRVDGLAYAQTPARPHESLGSIRHTGCAPEQALTFPPPSPITVGLHDDLINELLFSIWDGGTLALNLSGESANSLVGQFGLQEATIQVDPLLPPVFESCRGKDLVQLGDLFVDIVATFGGEPLHLGLWLLAEAPIEVDFVRNDEGALQAKLVVGSIDPLWIEVVANEGPFAENDQTVIDLVQDVLIPQLLGTVSDSATFTLPSIDLGALTSAVPAGTIIDLDIQAVARDNAYLTINGALK